MLYSYCANLVLLLLPTHCHIKLYMLTQCYKIFEYAIEKEMFWFNIDVQRTTHVKTTMEQYNFQL
jgi:hypothetical protein